MIGARYPRGWPDRHQARVGAGLQSVACRSSGSPASCEDVQPSLARVEVRQAKPVGLPVGPAIRCGYPKSRPRPRHEPLLGAERRPTRGDCQP